MVLPSGNGAMDSCARHFSVCGACRAVTPFEVEVPNL
jgi:hypothetical protein